MKLSFLRLALFYGLCATILIASASSAAPMVL